MSTFDNQVDAIADAMDADVADDVLVHICYGPPRCTRMDGQGCPDCYKVSADDPRTTDQILADMHRAH